MQKVTIDFETYSECDLKKCGAWIYSRHPSTEVMCLAFRHEDDDEVQLILPHDADPHSDLLDYVNDPMEFYFEAHNATFEIAIWKNVMSRYGWPDIALHRWCCSMAKCSAANVAKSLDQSSKMLGIGIEKDMVGNRLMQKYCKPRKPSKLDASIRHSDENDLQKIYAYCKQDVTVEDAVSHKLPNLSSSEQKIYLLTQRINNRGVYIDIKSAKKILEFISQYSEKLLKKLVELTDGEITTAGQRQRMIDWCGERGFPLDNLQQKYVTDLLADYQNNNMPKDVKTLLTIRSLLGKSSTKKFQGMIDRADPRDNRVRDLLVYHGASTGRWTGAGIQIQNFPRGTLKNVSIANKALDVSEDVSDFETFYPNVMNTFSSMLRSMMRAAPGNKFICSDYSAIEARGVFWLSGQWDGLDMFRDGSDIYKEMAAVIFDKNVKIIDPDERFVGKQSVLGCGYMMGAPRFVEQCFSFGRVVSEELALRAVTSYRSRFEKVVRNWYITQSAAITAVKHQGTVQRAGRIAFKSDGKFLLCRLPSGRMLSYYKPEVVLKETKYGIRDELRFLGINSMTKKIERQSTYGGKLVENIVQGIARDLMAHAMVECETAGYNVVLSVHDEIVSEVPKDFGSLEEFNTILSTPPKWAEDFPLAVEGWEGIRYKK